MGLTTISTLSQVFAAASLQLWGVNTNYHEMKLAEACLGYQDCSVTALVTPSKVWSNGRVDQFQLQVARLDLNGVEKRLAGCGLGALLNGKLSDSNGAPVLLLELQTATLKAPAPAFMTDEFLRSNDGAIKNALALGPTDPAAAGNQLIGIFGLKDAGYTIDATYVPTKGAESKAPDAVGMAYTSSGSKRVGLAASYKNGCLFWQVIRHELEHVAQNVHADKCAARGFPAYYNVEAIAEGSAYSGDSAYSTQYCSAAEALEIQANSLGAFKIYLKAR
jgi:hypothetical protein